MRTMYSRGNWRPTSRIAGLRRYAFIGDSMTFGHGVLADQTLPAVAERQMNAACADAPVQVVNFGINGYNLWNSWLDFIRVPQAYDGVVITLCSNDAEIFGRTYRIRYAEPRFPTWQAGHACGEAIRRCFEEIAVFGAERSLPIAVCYYSVIESAPAVHVGAILREICVAHGFPFIDSIDPILERNFPKGDRVVSDCNAHPSPIVHDAVGRHLVKTLAREGWLAAASAPSIDEIADQVVASTRAMVEVEHFSADAAHDWAIRTLEIKIHKARRSRALEADDHSCAYAAGVLENLRDVHRYWHFGQRLKALLSEIDSLSQGIAYPMCGAEEEALRLDELSFALKTGEWKRLMEDGRSIAPPGAQAAKLLPREALVFFDESIVQMQEFGCAIKAMRDLPAPDDPVSLAGKPEFEDSLNILSGLADRIIGQCRRLKEASLQMADPIAAATPTLDAKEIEHVSNLVTAALGQARKSLAFVHRWPKKIERIFKTDHATYTTIEISLRGLSVRETTHRFMFAVAEYLVPHRLPAQDLGNFMSDGSAKLITLSVPLFYMGRIILTANQVSGESAEVELIKVEVYNLAGQRRELLPDAFSQDASKRWVSPILYLY